MAGKGITKTDGSGHGMRTNTYRELQIYAKELEKRTGMEIDRSANRDELIRQIENAERLVAETEQDPERAPEPARPLRAPDPPRPIRAPDPPKPITPPRSKRIYTVRFRDLSDIGWKIAYRGPDVKKARAKYEAYKRTYHHTVIE